MIALDLFAGHGWGVACQKLGIEEYGVEIMPEAVATRTANGMRTIYHDVWEGLEIPPDVLDAYEHCYEDGPRYGHYTTLIASPPCQTFSMAGGGAGRKALDDVLEAIREKAYLDPAALRAFGEKHDPRTALVLTPLAHVARDTPTYVVFEQVPPVLPVWEACADEMRRWGYSVWTGNLQAEMYGVPQTRKRAVLIARADGIEAAPPVPTHSRYYPRDPQRLDPGVLPWVSMAEALGWTVEPGEITVTGLTGSWGMTNRPYPTVAVGVEKGGGTDPLAVGGSAARKIIYDARERGDWVDERPGAEHHDPEKPATTVAGDPRISSRDHHEPGAQSGRAMRVTIEEAAALQSYPPGFVFSGTKTKQFLQVGNAVPPLLAEAILKGFLS